MPGPSQALVFPGVSRPVILPDAPELRDGLHAVLRGWTPEARPATAEDRRKGRHLARIARAGDGTWRLTSAHLDAPLAGLATASALCGLVADLVEGFIAARPGCLVLHGGAARLGGRLVALTGPARAGKSTLVARLAAEPGVEVFCDDALPILPDGTALGLGIAPRLRVPLPRAAGATLRRHLAAHAGPRDHRCAYLATPSLVPHGTRAPLAALVQLDRRGSGPARLHRLPPGEILHHLIARNMGEFATPGAAFEAARGLAAAVAGLRLVYARLDDAVRVLKGAFEGPDLRLDALPADAEAPPPAHPPRRTVAPAQRWRRAPDAAIRRHAGATFLWRAGDPVLWRLNAVAGAVWALLEAPMDAAAIARVLREVFPEEPEARLRRHAGRLLAALAAEGLILPG